MASGVIALVLLALQVCHCTTQSSMTKNCSKLRYHSKSGNLCLPCSLCNSSLPQKRFRSECKRKHNDPISLYGGLYLWCDNPEGPFPECPLLPNYLLVENCSESCQDRHRRFAPGCECKVRCSGQPSQTVLCTLDLQWDIIPEECTTTTVATLLSTTTDISLQESKSAVSLTVIILCIALGFVLILIVGTGISVYIIRNKPCQQSLSPSSSEQGSISPFLKGKKAGSDANEDAEHFVSENSDLPEVEVLKAEKVVVTETDYLQSRSAPIQAKVDTDVVPSWDWRALGALLDSLQDVDKINMMFDQQYEFGNPTWHAVACRLLNWEKSKVKHVEYSRARNYREETPRDGCMYKVLKEAHEKGYGLLSLLECLESLDFRNEEAEKELRTFMEKFQCENNIDQIC